jgi:hypothetical protein
MELWNECEDRWGRGGVYRPYVADQMRAWFEDQGHLHKALEAKIRLAWWTEVLGPLRTLCDETTAEADEADE